MTTLTAGQSVDWEQVKRIGEQRRGKKVDRFIPPLNVPLLQAKYDPARAHYPRVIPGTFKAPIDIKPNQFDRLKLVYAQKFVEAMESMGWEFYSAPGIKVVPSNWAAEDLITKEKLPDQLEWMILAAFRCKKPEPVRTEIDPKHLEPTKVS